jgi:glucan-binding YG repeat protein
LKQELEKAEKTQFDIVKRGVSDKAKKLREQLEQESQMKEKFGDADRQIKAKPVPSFIHESKPIKLTTAAILREDALVRKTKREEEKALQEIELSLRDASEFYSWQEEVKLKGIEPRIIIDSACLTSFPFAAEEEERLEKERRRLAIQLLHEETFVAKQEKMKENQSLVLEVKSEKETWKYIATQSKMEQALSNKKKIEEVHEIEENVKGAKEKVVQENQKKVAEVVMENHVLKERLQREAEEELARKTELIQQIRLLERNVPAVGTYIKNLDLTETSGLGLLGEMSITEVSHILHN